MLPKGCLSACTRALAGQFKGLQIHPTTSYIQTRTIRGWKAPLWWIRPRHAFVKENVTPANQAYLADITAEIYKEKAENSPLKSQPWPREQWTPGSVRTGLLAKKIGYFPQFDKNGKQIVCTLLQIQDNHVLSYTDPITWYKQSRVGKKEGQKFLGRLTIGANSMAPSRYTAAYRGLFEEAGVMPKEKIASFAITPNAKIQPGTRLYATHFRVGQYVDMWGRTMARGFQGVMKRWGFAGGPKTHGSTKFHRKPGSLGDKTKGYVQVGKKMAGHMGNAWRPLRGAKIIRINTKYQILYLHCKGVMGNIGNYIYVKDCGYVHRRVENPPFPTHYVEEEKTPLPEEYFDKDLYQFTQPTITYQLDDEKKAKGGVKVKKQAKAKGKK